MLSWGSWFVICCELTTIKTGATLDRAVCEESVTLPRQRAADGRNQFITSACTGVMSDE